MNIVGQQVKRVDAYGKVTGEAKYTADLEPRDILHGKVVHSTIANGLVKSFDLTEAYQVPGVVKIVTCFDVPDCQFPTAGHPWSVEKKHQDICDRKILNQRVRLYGDDIAAVIAEDEVAAARAARLIKVEYEEYTPIVTVEAAMAEDATPLHPDLRKNNVIVHSHMTMGDSDFTYEDGIPQAAWFAECLTDDLADAIGMDPCEFRLKNCMEDGFVDPANGITFHSYGLKKCIEEGRRHIRWDEKWSSCRNQTGPVRKGVGMAIFCYKTGVHPISLETASARMILNQDGSMQLCMGATEIGQGADTVFTQMASQTTGIAFDKVYIVSTQDTDVTPFDTGAYASRQTYVSGMACKKCGEEFRLKILEYAAYMLSHDVSDLSKTVYADEVKAASALLRETLGLKEGELVSADMLDIENSKIVVSGGEPVLFDLSVVADTAFYSLDRSVHITAEVTNQCKDNTFSSGCCFVEIEVDIPLGLVTVKDIINVHDSGVLINPMTARAQVHGGMSMGLGYGLSEELLVDEKTGRPLNNNLLDYKIPTAMDTPDLNVAFIELEDPTGPYGNKSLGEPPAIPVAPAIRNAILNATGVHMDVTPMTAQRLIEKFKEKGLI
ncbi:molybdopterin-dependent oxidoreductase [Enterocloster clostridioformis]